jgi:two-component system, NarL family, nitrate/nitrite response regulator NarL
MSSRLATDQVDKPIRILIADILTLVRTGVKMIVESHPTMVVIGEAGSRQEAISIAAQTQPNIILLELNLDESANTDVITELVSAAPNARVILVTAIHDVLIHHRAVESGAVGIVLQDQPADVLLKAIEKVHSGEAWLDRATMAHVLARMSRGRMSDDIDAEKIASLSQREREVIRLLGQGLKSRQIAEELEISQITVRHHLTSIFSKLDITDRLELIIYAYQHHLADLPR